MNTEHGWDNFEEYKVGDNEYDITSMSDDSKLFEMYNLLKQEGGFNLKVKNEEDRSNIGETSADS